MKKTINISLGGLNFCIEEDAYQRLDRYLNEVRGHFASYREAEEIVSDIEARFAEQFGDKAGGQKPVTPEEVEKVIGIMGSPRQFGDRPFSDDAAPSQTPSTPRRLYRSTDDVIIAGVASGIAAYIGADPVWVRLAFFLSVFLGGTGILIYILLWIILPEAKTETEKMQMRGEPITLKNLEQTVKEKAGDLKKNSGQLKNAGSAGLRGLGKVVRTLALIFVGFLKIVAKIIGAIIAAAGIFAVAMLVFAGFTVIFNANSPYVDIPLNMLAHNTLYYTGIAAAFVAAVLPVVALVFLGVSIVSGKSAFNKIAGFSFLGIWIVAAAVAANIGIRLAPQIEQAINSSPQYSRVTKQLDLKDFNKVDAGGADVVDIIKGDVYSVSVEGRQKDIDNTEITVRDGTLVSGHRQARFCLFCWERPLRITVTTPVLEAAGASGATKLNVSGFAPAAFDLKLSGASQATVSIGTQKFAADLSGASRLTLSGSTTTLTLQESGASRVDANGLTFHSTSTAITAKLSGASRLEFTGDVILGNFTASGASRVSAPGANITQVTAKLSGSSRLDLGNIGALEAQASGASKITYLSAVQVETDLSGSSKAEQASPLEPAEPYFRELYYQD